MPIPLPQRVVLHTPAKLNFFLEVRAKRPDGFHEIETLMQAIGIYDTLQFTPTSDRQIRLTCDWTSGAQARERAAQFTPTDGTAAPALGTLPPPAKNIVVQALTLLQQERRITLGAEVHLIKRIPAAAGLGGASSDAAAALIAANSAWGINLSREELRQVAAQIGSDIPFFLTPGAAVCRGRGEIIEPVRRSHAHVVVVRPPVGLSTPEVYRHCRPADLPVSTDRLQNDLEKGDFAAAGRTMLNRLQPPAAALTPWIDRLAEEFTRLDCWGHQMSGSGSSYFGLCRSARQARRVASQLRSRDLGTVFCTTTAALPT